MSAGPSQRISLVRVPKRRVFKQEDFLQTSLQGILFPISRRNLAVVVRFPDVTDEEFKTVLEFAKPRLIADFRSVPTFSIGRLNRRLIFDAFKKVESVYVELAVFPPSGEQPDIERTRAALLMDVWQTQRGPVVFLTHRCDSPEGSLPRPIRNLLESCEVKWDLLEVPQYR